MNTCGYSYKCFILSGFALVALLELLVLVILLVCCRRRRYYGLREATTEIAVESVEVVVQGGWGKDGFGLEYEKRTAYNTGGGVKIIQLRESSKAEEAGFQVGDKILEIDGVAVKTEEDITRNWNDGSKAKADGAIIFRVERAVVTLPSHQAKMDDQV